MDDGDDSGEEEEEALNLAARSSPPSLEGSSSPGEFTKSQKGSPTSTALASIQSALAALQAGQMSLNQLQALGAQNMLQNQIAAAVANQANSMTFPFVVPPNLNPNGGSGIGNNEIQALQLALQQQQQNLQQQLQNFLFLQQQQMKAGIATSVSSQTVGSILHAQSQQVSQTTAQLRRLQRQQKEILNQRLHNSCQTSPALETPKAKDLLLQHKKAKLSHHHHGSSVDGHRDRHHHNNNSPNVSLALSSLTPVSMAMTPVSSMNNNPFPLCSDSPTTITRPLTVSTTVANGSTSPNLGNLPSPPMTFGQRLDLPADENVDLEELEQFAKEFKQRRIKLGKSV